MEWATEVTKLMDRRQPRRVIIEVDENKYHSYEIMAYYAKHSF